MKEKNLEILRIIFVEDKNGGFTSFFKGLSGIISQGETKDEAKESLMNTLYDTVKWLNDDNTNKDK